MRAPLLQLRPLPAAALLQGAQQQRPLVLGLLLLVVEERVVVASRRTAPLPLLLPPWLTPWPHHSRLPGGGCAQTH
jgi:hypothetical protein